MSDVVRSPGTDPGADAPSRPSESHGDSGDQAATTPNSPAVPEDLATRLATQVGPTRLGQYALLEKIGQGGMGTVYRALHTRLKRVVAVKVLPAERTHHPEMLARFQREMEVIGGLDHPHIVRATDAGEAEGRHFLVMEFIDGLDLARLARACGRLRLADACEIVRQAALGLQCAHEHRLVHRDVKPSNLILATDGCVKLLDLGLARWQGSADEELTDLGQVLGTADYMAPEQGAGSEVDIRADLYALGCTLYRLLAGQALFPAPRYTSTPDKVWAHAHVPAPSVQDIRDDVPPRLQMILVRLLAKSAVERYATPGEVAAALGEFAAGSDLTALLSTARQALASLEQSALLAPDLPRPLLPATDPASPSLSPRPRRWPLLWAAAAVLILAGIILAIVLPRQTPPPTPTGDTPQPPADGWVDLLERPPTELDWPSGPGSRWDHKAERGELWVNALHTGLLRLGETSSDCEIELRLQQVRWDGLGLFLGHRPAQFKGHPCRQYQLLRIVSHLDNTPMHRIDLERVLVRRLTEAANVQEELAAVRLPPLRAEGHRLRLQIKNGVLVQVCWDEAELKELTTPEVNAHLGRTDCEGAFGVYTSRNSGVILGARLRVAAGGP